MMNQKRFILENGFGSFVFTLPFFLLTLRVCMMNERTKKKKRWECGKDGAGEVVYIAELGQKGGERERGAEERESGVRVPRAKMEKNTADTRMEEGSARDY